MRARVRVRGGRAPHAGGGGGEVPGGERKGEEAGEK